MLRNNAIWYLSGILSGVVLFLAIFLFSNNTVRENKPHLDKFRKVMNHLTPSHPFLIKITNSTTACTAFVIDGQYAITAAHCVHHTGKSLPSESFKVWDPMGNDTQVMAEVVSFDDITDSAALRADFRDFQAANIDTLGSGLLLSTSKEGSLKTCGFPYGQNYPICTPFFPKAMSYSYMTGIGALFPGQSGGPVIDEEAHMVVGINHSVSEGYITIVPLTGVLSVLGLENGT